MTGGDLLIIEEIDILLIKQAAQQHFPDPIELERTKTGLSTYVYRIRHNNEITFMRVLPENASFAAEALAHDIMLERGVNVPKPIWFEHKNPLLAKSVMLTSEISGHSIERYDQNRKEILNAAGKQLAMINSIEVDGFGWIDRNHYKELKGEKSTFKDYYYDKLYSDIDLLSIYDFDTGSIKKIMEKAYPSLAIENAFLAHGDFDSSHIFSDKGSYTGIIDFGEIRGSHRLYDLGHFKLHESFEDFQRLLAGYTVLYPISDDDLVKIDYLALFVGLGRSKYEHYRKLIKKQLDLLR